MVGIYRSPVGTVKVVERSKVSESEKIRMVSTSLGEVSRREYLKAKLMELSILSAKGHKDSEAIRAVIEEMLK